MKSISLSVSPSFTDPGSSSFDLPPFGPSPVVAYRQRWAVGIPTNEQIGWYFYFPFSPLFRFCFRSSPPSLVLLFLLLLFLFFPFLWPRGQIILCQVEIGVYFRVFFFTGNWALRVRNLSLVKWRLLTGNWQCFFSSCLLLFIHHFMIDQ